MHSLFLVWISKYLFIFANQRSSSSFTEIWPFEPSIIKHITAFSNCSLNSSHYPLWERAWLSSGVSKMQCTMCLAQALSPAPFPGRLHTTPPQSLRQKIQRLQSAYIYSLQRTAEHSQQAHNTKGDMETRLSLVLALLLAALGVVANALSLPGDELKDSPQVSQLTFVTHTCVLFTKLFCGLGIQKGLMPPLPIWMLYRCTCHSWKLRHGKFVWSPKGN